MICDAFTAERVGFAALRAAIAPVGDFGRRAADRFVPFAPGDEAEADAAIAAVLAAADAHPPDRVAAARAALRGVPDPGPVLARARSGEPLADVDFYELGRFVDALDRVRAVASAIPDVAALRALLAPGKTTYGFLLADAFDETLAPARAALDATQGALDAAIDAARDRIAPALGMRPDDEEFVVLRAPAFVVPAGVRIVRETPTYLLCTLALDDVLLARTRARDDAAARLTSEEERVRARLAEAVARERASVVAATEALGEYDVLLARVAFAHRYGGCRPTFAHDRVAFVDATYVPLRDALVAADRAYVPLSLAFANVAVLTGPNMGGKSAALATCGFLALCVAYGVPPPAASATLPLVARVAWLGGDSPDDRKRLLSSFGADVVRATAILRDDVAQLILVDEFARTTSPREGRALLVGLVRHLATRSSPAFVATHFDGVAEAAHVAHLAVAGIAENLAGREGLDLAQALDVIAHAMDYRIVSVARDAPHRSDAFALAELLGLDAAIVATARRCYDFG